MKVLSVFFAFFIFFTVLQGVSLAEKGYTSGSEEHNKQWSSDPPRDTSSYLEVSYLEVDLMATVYCVLTAESTLTAYKSTQILNFPDRACNLAKQVIFSVCGGILRLLERLKNTINNNHQIHLEIQNSYLEVDLMVAGWVDFIKAMLVEAKWCSTGYTPSLEEHLNNGWLSSSGCLSSPCIFATQEKLTSEALEGLDKLHDLLHCSSMMFRLLNDMATSSAEIERGDVASSIMCYMLEKNVTEGEARTHIRGLIMEAWKKLNGSMFESPFASSFVNISLNLARTSLCIYQYGDRLGVEDSNSKEHILSLIVRHVDVEVDKNN